MGRIKSNSVAAVILAAGKSKRIKTDTPKVLLELAGRPLLFHIIETVNKVKKISKVTLVLNHQKEAIRKHVCRVFPRVSYAIQPRCDGTAKAVSAAQKLFQSSQWVIVLCGDAPLIREDTIKHLIATTMRHNADCGVVTAYLHDKNDLGIIERDARNRIKGIREKKFEDTFSGSEEVNSGLYCFKRASLIEGLRKIKRNAHKGEYFLTDIISYFYNNNRKIVSYVVEDEEEILGVNTQQSLSKARTILNKRLIKYHMDQGVSFVDPNTTIVSYDTKIGKNTILYPFTFIEKNVIIGANCQVGPFAYLAERSVLPNFTRFQETRRKYTDTTF